MQKSTPSVALSSATAPPASRSDARYALWKLVEESAPGNVPVRARHFTKNKLPALSSSIAHSLLKRGISSQTLGPLSDFLGLGKGAIADYLELDRSTANRWSVKGLPLPLHSAESVLRLLELEQMAADTFEEEDEASQWLSKPHPMLEGDSPLAAAKTSYGAQRVKDILLAIKYGGVV